MASSQDTEHNFFEVLAGREKGHPTAESLREAIQAENETIKQAETAQTEKLPDYEMARLDAVKKQLIQNGVFKQNSFSEPSWLRKFFYLFNFNFVSQNWGAGFAVAASVMVVSVIVFQQPTKDTPTNIVKEMETMRGGPSTDLAQAEKEHSKTYDLQQKQMQEHLAMQKQIREQQRYASQDSARRSAHIHQRQQAQQKNSYAKINKAAEPDDSVTDENTQIASAPDALPNEAETSAIEQNPQIASEQESAPKVEQYAKAEDPNPRTFSGAFGGYFGTLITKDTQNKEGALNGKIMGKSSIGSTKKHGLAFFDRSPEKKVSDLQNKFSQIGAEVVVALINDDTWIVEVSVPDATKLEAIKKQMVKEGFYKHVIDANPPYEIRVQREK